MRPIFFMLGIIALVGSTHAETNLRACVDDTKNNAELIAKIKLMSAQKPNSVEVAGAEELRTAYNITVHNQSIIQKANYDVLHDVEIKYKNGQVCATKIKSDVLK